MALETLKGINRVGQFPIIVMDDLREQHPDKFNESGAMDWEWFERDIRPHNFIYVRQDKNSLSFTLQNGPVREMGVNGCQVDDVIAVARTIIEGLDEKFPSPYNQMAIDYLSAAERCLADRKRERESRGVEGTSQA